MPGYPVIVIISMFIVAGYPVGAPMFRYHAGTESGAMIIPRRAIFSFFMIVSLIVRGWPGRIV